MFDGRIRNYINEIIPELTGLRLSVGGKELSIGDYEKLNALLIQNNVLDGNSKNIAIFHPGSDLLDIYTLVIMGISAYKQTIINSAKFKIKDFTPGELIEYGGKVVRYGGIYTNSSDKNERFEIGYDDKYKTTERLPLYYFSGVSKYNGTKTNADKYEGKGAVENTKDSLRSLFKLQEDRINLSGYPTFLISSQRQNLLKLLDEVVINETPFYQMFPSVKCTTDNRYRLGKNPLQRSFMFYFVSSLSTADDVLRSEPHIRTLFIDARGKVLNDGTLLASIRNQYKLEDVYWLQSYERLDSVQKLDNLDFKIWIWVKKDFAGFEQPQNTSDVSGEFAKLVNIHNTTPSRLADYADIPMEVPYPQNITIGQHNIIQSQIRNMFSLCEEYCNTELEKFTIHAAGLVNRLFQSVLPVFQTDAINNQLERRTFSEDVDDLRNRIDVLSTGPLPEDFKNNALSMISNLETAIKAFDEYNGKSDCLTSIIIENRNKRICVYLNPKYQLVAPTVKETVINNLNRMGFTGLESKLVFTDKLAEAIVDHHIIVWTFKPFNKDFLMLEPEVNKNIILLYPLQKKEFEQTILYNSNRFQKYMDINYRADILKISIQMLQNLTPEIQKTETDSFDLERLLAYTITKILPSYKADGRTELVDARMVLFSDGNHALFQAGNKIRVLDVDSESIETKTVNSLVEGDQVVFLKDSKRTVFEELVDFYQHKPEIIELVRLSELWRTALLAYMKANYLFNPNKVKSILDGVGLVRHAATIEGWINGATICPDEDNYKPVDIIAKLTKDFDLNNNLEKVKEASRKIHSLRIKIGRYLTNKITQSYMSPESVIDDPVLRNKLDEMIANVQIAQVSFVNNETSKVPVDIVNKLLTVEDI